MSIVRIDEFTYWQNTPSISYTALVVQGDMSVTYKLRTDYQSSEGTARFIRHMNGTSRVRLFRGVPRAGECITTRGFTHLVVFRFTIIPYIYRSEHKITQRVESVFIEDHKDVQAFAKIARKLMESGAKEEDVMGEALMDEISERM